MSTVREALVTKLGNPLCDKSHVELTLRLMLSATEASIQKSAAAVDEVAA